MCVNRGNELSLHVLNYNLLLDLGQNLRVPEEEVLLCAKVQPLILDLTDIERSPLRRP